MHVHSARVGANIFTCTHRKKHSELSTHTYMHAPTHPDTCANTHTHTHACTHTWAETGRKKRNNTTLNFRVYIYIYLLLF